MAFARYRASGRISPRFAVGAAAAIVGAAVLAWPYQKLIGWIPYIYLNLLIYLGAALAVGFLAALASKWGQNRNALVGALLGAVIGATLVATSHYVAYRTVVDDVVQQLKEHGLSEGTAERAVGDTLTFGRYVESPVTLTIDDDVIVDIAGDGLDAELFREYLAAFDDRDAYATSHVGWGMNPAARWDVLALYDRRELWGTEVRAFAGNFLYSTGANEVAGRYTLGHFDLPLRGCTVLLDGRPVVEAGVLA